MQSQIFLIHALTPIHIGNDIGLGAINLPTMREVHTGYPVIPGSSIKGVLREQFRDRPEVAQRLFGPERGAEADARGDLAFGDAQLLALPVRSLYGTFAWVTCPHALARFARDLKLTGESIEVPKLERSKDDHALVPSHISALTSGTAPGQVFLEDFTLTAEKTPVLDKIATAIAELGVKSRQLDAEFLKQRLLCVHDDLFAHFARTCLEVRARVKIDHTTGTAAASGPWTEEHLPAETLLCGLVVGRTEKPTVLEQALGAELRFGGRATLGLGRACMTLSSPNQAK